MDYIDRLEEMESLHKTIQSLQKREKELSKATVTDNEEIRKLCMKCKEYFMYASSPYNRRVLLFSLLLFISPHTLIGLRVRRGQRKMLCNIFYNNANPSVVSTDISTAIFDFRHYDDFKENVYLTISKIEQILKRDG